MDWRLPEYKLVVQEAYLICVAYTNKHCSPVLDVGLFLNLSTCILAFRKALLIFRDPNTLSEKELTALI